MVNWLNPLVHWDRLIGNVKSSGSFAFMMYGVYSSFWPGSTNWHTEQEGPGIAALNLQLTIWPSRTLALGWTFFFFFFCPCSIHMPVLDALSGHVLNRGWESETQFTCGVFSEDPASLKDHVIYSTMLIKWEISWFIAFFLLERLYLCVCFGAQIIGCCNFDSEIPQQIKAACNWTYLIEADGVRDTDLKESVFRITWEKKNILLRRWWRKQQQHEALNI